MWWLFIIVVVVFIVYLISKDYKSHVKMNITNYGGMQKKYAVLIDYFTQGNSAKIAKITKDNITIVAKSAIYYIDYVGNNVEISMKANIPIIGKVSKRWKFPDGYPQERMIDDITNYIEWQWGQIEKVANNNFEQYLN
jgi:hypothetical protein